MKVVLVLTNRCNMACAYCKRAGGPVSDMPKDIAFRAVDFALQNNPRELQLGFYGGEPLLQFALIRAVVEYAKALRSPARLSKLMTTNGTLLTPDACDWLRRERFHVTVSLDGAESTHDTLRRFPGGGASYHQCVEGLRHATGRKLLPQVLMVADPRTISDLANGVFALYRNEGVRRLAVVCNHDAHWPEEALDALEVQYETIGDLVADSYRTYSPLSVNFIRNKLRTHISGAYSACSRCRFGAHELFVDPAGRFFPCERFVGEDAFCMGGIQDGLDDSRVTRLNRELNQARSECSRCPVAPRCVHWCGCRNYARTGSLAGFDSFICRHEKMAIRIADRVGDTLFGERNLPFLAEFYGLPWLRRAKGKVLTALRTEKNPVAEDSARNYWR